MPASRNATLSLGKRSSTPLEITEMIEIICSNGCVFMKAQHTLRHLRRRVKRNRHAELLGRGIDRIELRLAEGGAGAHIRRHHDSDGAEARYGAVDFLYRFRRGLRSDDCGGLDPAARGLTELMGPIVVRARERGGEIELAHQADRKRGARIRDHELDSLGFHVAHVRLGIRVELAQLPVHPDIPSELQEERAAAAAVRLWEMAAVAIIRTVQQMAVAVDNTIGTGHATSSKLIRLMLHGRDRL